MYEHTMGRGTQLSPEERADIDVMRRINFSVNSSTHASTSSQAWLAAKNIPILPWPARSPDVNLMENVWGFLVRRLYEYNNQYANVNDHKIAINKEWDEIEPNIHFCPN